MQSTDTIFIAEIRRGSPAQTASVVLIMSRMQQIGNITEIGENNPLKSCFWPYMEYCLKRCRASELFTVINRHKHNNFCRSLGNIQTARKDLDTRSVTFGTFSNGYKFHIYILSEFPILSGYIVRAFTNTSVMVVWTIGPEFFGFEEARIRLLSSSNQEVERENISLSNREKDVEHTFMGLTPGETYNIVFTRIKDSEESGYGDLTATTCRYLKQLSKTIRHFCGILMSHIILHVYTYIYGKTYTNVAKRI